jgi:hypothetical protein
LCCRRRRRPSSSLRCRSRHSFQSRRGVIGRLMWRGRLKT